MYYMRGLFQVFKNKSMRRQMITVAMSLIAVFAVAQIASRFTLGNPQNWDIITLEYMLNPGVTFTAEQYGDAINATLINSGFSGEIRVVSAFQLAFFFEDIWHVVPFSDEIQIVSTFQLAFLDENNHWRIVPFNEEIPLIGLVTLPEGYRINHQITRDMVAVNLRPGNYRLFTQIWWEEYGGTTASNIWVDFDLD
jgi:hypothetical protein